MCFIEVNFENSNIGDISGVLFFTFIIYSFIIINLLLFLLLLLFVHLVRFGTILYYFCVDILACFRVENWDT